MTYMPNPNPKGTFVWAREEAKRGNRIGRLRWGGSWDPSTLGTSMLRTSMPQIGRVSLRKAPKLPPTPLHGFAGRLTVGCAREPQ